MPDGNTRFGSF